MTVADLVAVVRATCRVVARDWPETRSAPGEPLRDIPDLDTVLQGVLDELAHERPDVSPLS